MPRRSVTLTLVGLLALVSLAAAVFATGKMRYIDDTYGGLLDGPGRANGNATVRNASRGDARRLAERQRSRRALVREQLPAAWKRLRKSAAHLN